MAGTYTRWYREGTVALTSGSNLVTGTNTYWLTAGLNPGDIFSLDGITDYEILSIADNTHITIKSSWGGESISGATYHIIRNFTAHMPSQIAAQLSDMYSDLTRYWNQDTQTVHGKSAYEIAKLHGFIGTESEWLESLKGAGEIVTLNNRTNILTYHNEGAHNAFFRGKKLGTAITASQIANIKNGSFSDIYPGDYWVLPIDGTTTAFVAGCNVNLYRTGLPNHIIVVLENNRWNFPINDTATCEGHFYNSKMFTVHLPYILAKAKEVIPEEYILTFKENIGDSIDTNGNKNHNLINVDVQIGLPSYTNISGLYNENYNKNSGYGISSNYIWPIYRHSPASRRRLMWAWINESHSKTNWYCLSWAITPESTAANSTEYSGYQLKVMPYIMLG